LITILKVIVINITMVKNKMGGNKSKKSARKLMNPVTTNRKLRLAEEGETYAVVIKLYGGPNCEVVTNDGVKRLCVIRNKFRGRDKRDNTIEAGVWILVGIREWEARSNKALKCDLLEVYNSGEKDKLKTMTSLNLAHIIRMSEGDENKYAGDDIIFEDNTLLSQHKEGLASESAERDVKDIGLVEDTEFIDIDEI
jgi:translation initiation factor IF-1